jgi:hypothetical protein
VGVLLVSAGLVLLVFPLVQGRELGWPAWTYGMTVASVPVLSLFGVHQVRRRAAGRSPLVEPALLRSRAFSGGLVVGLIFFAAMTGLVLVLGLYLQLGLGFSPLEAGLTQAPWALGVAAGAALFDGGDALGAIQAVLWTTVALVLLSAALAFLLPRWAPPEDAEGLSSPAA